ncbi:MAG: excinuclease ABC subunit UvrA, partial [bacterium]
MSNSQHNKIIIRGARTHNLQNINLDIPHNQFVVITGLSGSGKSSLAFDTIYAEGQRRYIESLSAYARQFLGVMNKPDADQISGLSPTISIDQRSVGHNPRSTVGTTTEIYDYLRLLFARLGQPHCPNCGAKASRQTPEQIINKISQLPLGAEILLLANLIKDQKGEHKRTLQEVEKAGYGSVKIDGALYNLEEATEVRLDKNKDHTIQVVVIQLIIDKNRQGQLVNQERLAKTVAEAMDLGNGSLAIERLDTGETMVFSQNLYCATCDVGLPEIEPRSFSFNSPHGACPSCDGLGVKLEIDPKMLIPNDKLSLAEGAIRPWSKIFANQIWYWQILDKVAELAGFSTKTPVNQLSQSDLDIILNGSQNEKINFEGVVPILEKKYKETNSDYIRKELENYMRESICPSCQGQRLKSASLAVTVGGLSIAQVSALAVVRCLEFFKELIGPDKQNKIAKVKLTPQEKTIIKQLAGEVNNRLTYLLNVGLGYLTLDRPANTLAGGEAQRIRLASQIGSLLTGVTYVLDEPSIGLHQRDNEKLIKTMKSLRDLGNSV